MLGQILLSDGEKDAAECVKEITLSLKGAYDKVWHSIEETHKANKSRHDDKESGSIRDLVYVPAIKHKIFKLVAGTIHWDWQNKWCKVYVVQDTNSRHQ